ncbi:MAG: response regulator transcription factor [Clostridia bacterium]|nr:response regulator transcription factor [Clostridia bacterium]
MIFCVEDDTAIRNMMIYTLKASGFEAEGFPDGTSFQKALLTLTPDLVLLDIMLPGEDGISILKHLRESNKHKDLPVILASAKGTEYDKVLGLDTGADDYLAKPFGMMEMISRVRAVLRRTKKADERSVLTLADLTLDLDCHTVTVRNEPLVLTKKEFDLLRLFLENPNRVFSRDKLLELVWSIEYLGESRTVDVHIGTLRDKLGMCGNAIETVRGVGYRLNPALIGE